MSTSAFNRSGDRSNANPAPKAVSRNDARLDAAGANACQAPVSALYGNKVVNRKEETLGSISEILLDVSCGRIAYVLLASGGFMGVGERLFAIPWNALTLDMNRKCFVLDAERSDFENAPSFDKDHWPTVPDTQWHEEVHRYYGARPYWD
jgi:sporulation protein YlmC with PRC-barrel domain